MFHDASILASPAPMGADGGDEGREIGDHRRREAKPPYSIRHKFNDCEYPCLCASKVLQTELRTFAYRPWARIRARSYLMPPGLIRRAGPSCSRRAKAAPPAALARLCARYWQPLYGNSCWPNLALS